MVATPAKGDPSDSEFISNEERAEAKRRRDIILRFEERGRFDDASVRAAAAEFGMSKAQFNRYRRTYRERRDLTCLLPEGSNGGLGQFRLDPRVEAVIKEVRLEYDREKPNAKDHHHYKEIRFRCRQRGLQEPDFKTLRSRFAGIPIRERRHAKYGGKYARERHDPIFGETPATTYPLQRIQIDHTLVDVVCTGEEDRRHIGRPWITLAIDEFSRCILGHVISWEYPNATTVALLITRIMLPKDDLLSRLGSKIDWPMYGKPDGIFVDQANELSSAEVKFGCEEWNIPKPETRPGGMTHWGGIIERFMGNAMDAVRLLKGSTADSRGFGKTKTRDPNETAEMSLSELELWLLEAIYQYHGRPHSGLAGKQPGKTWMRGIYGTEREPGRGEAARINDRLKLFLDFADMEERTVQRYGVRLDGALYWGEALRPILDYGSQKSFVIKRIPYDISRIWILSPIDDRYHELHATNLKSERPTLWEWDQARRKKRAEREPADVARQDESIERQREIERQAKSKTNKHRHRLNQERRAGGDALIREVGADQDREVQAVLPSTTAYRRDVHFEIDDN